MVETNENFERKKIPIGTISPSVAAKWSAPVLDEGYVPFPKRLLRCIGKIFEGDDAIDCLAVVLAVVDFKRDVLTREPSLSFLAFTAGMQEDRFEGLLKKLQAKKLITIKDGRDGLDISIKGLLKKIETMTNDIGA